MILLFHFLVDHIALLIEMLLEVVYTRVVMLTERHEPVRHLVPLQLVIALVVSSILRLLLALVNEVLESIRVEIAQVCSCKRWCFPDMAR